MANQDASLPSTPVATADDEPVSARIRARLLAARQRFHANDSIASHIAPGELEALQHEVEARVEDVLRALVIDVDQDHNTRETAPRVAKMYLREIFAGRYARAPSVTEFPNV